MKAKLFTGMLMSVLMIFSIGIFSQEANYSNNIFPLEQVKHGMTGYCISDLGPDFPRKMKFRVESVELNSRGYGHAMIWALIYDNPVFEGVNIGVIAGMSGSPCYSEDGRFLGTVSYGWPESLKPQPGIVPAKDVLSISDKIAGTALPNTNQVAVSQNSNSAINKNSITSLMCFGVGNNIQKFNDLNNLFSIPPARFGAVGIGAQADPSSGLEVSDKKLKPGDSIGVGLVVGDIVVGGTGTVSFVDGKNVWIFGHPMFQMGEVNFAMLSAETQGVFFVQSGPFKNTNTEKVIGTFTQDHLSAVYGHLGQMPDMIPVTVNLERSGKKETLHFYVVRQKFLTPVLVKIVIDNLLAEFSDLQELSIFSKGEICIKDSTAKLLYFSEHGEGLVSDIEDYCAREIRLATTSKNRGDDSDKSSTRIESVNIDLSVSEGDKTFSIAEIENCSVDTATNSSYDIDVILKNGQEQKTVSFSLAVPRGFKGEIVVLAGDAEVMTTSLDKENSHQNTKSSGQQDDLNSLLKRSFRKGSLYVKIFYINKASDLEPFATLRPVISTKIYEIILDNVVVEGQKSTTINIGNSK